jgi:hypothetical protein
MTNEFEQKFEQARRRVKPRQPAPAERLSAHRDAASPQRDDYEVSSKGRPRKQADTLIEIAEAAELFHARDGMAYGDLLIGEHRETWAVRSKRFRHWLARRFYEKTEGAPNSEALQSALNVIEARAHHDAPERDVYLRIGGSAGRIYLDLADEQWRVIQIGADGWQVTAAPPVRFRRAAGMLPMPVPVAGGSITLLRAFLNVGTGAEFTLAVAYLLAALRERGPYPVLDLSGEQGSAKSTTAAMLRALIDPNTAPLRALPRDERDLFIAANNGHVLAFDNVSGLPQWLSDALCRLASGGGFATRQLHTDHDEVLFSGAKPIILNGIEDTVSRPDLAERTLFLTLEAIGEERRRPEQELWEAFERKRPLILGALLDAVVHGLHQLPDVQLDRLPRMADFARWVTACETSVWPSGTFMRAYDGNRDAATGNVIEADPVATTVRSFMAERTEWTGTATELLCKLSEVAGERTARAKDWPASARTLSGRIRRAATPLRKVGIEITFEKDSNRNRSRVIRIQNMGAEQRPHRPHYPNDAGISELHADSSAAVSDGRDAASTNGADAADGADARLPSVAAGLARRAPGDGP